MKSEFRLRPIPWRDHAPTSTDYKDIPVDPDDPRGQEPLVDLADYGIAGYGYYARKDGLNAPYRRAFPSADARNQSRRSVAERLAEIDARLKETGIELFVLNGFRPLALQRELWSFFLERAGELLDDPSDEDRAAFAVEYCSDPRCYDPTDSRTWPTHVTGGAVDLTLRASRSGEFLFMGGIFDDPDPISHTAYFEKRLLEKNGEERALSLSQREALRNRRLLYWAMTEGGFASYAFEWWHFDLGTQMWIANGGGAEDEPAARRALYGPAY
ncbi:MAG: M15 family metallopeptidase [Pseudomonadota bacterium]